MTAYIVVNIADVGDPDLYARYRSQVSEGISRAGGRYLVRGGAVDVLEGEWRPSRLVVVEFETSALARAWWGGEAYAALRELRRAATRTEMILVEGVADDPKPAGSRR